MEGDKCSFPQQLFASDVFFGSCLDMFQANWSFDCYCLFVFVNPLFFCLSLIMHSFFLLKQDKQLITKPNPEYKDSLLLF